MIKLKLKIFRQDDNEVVNEGCDTRRTILDLTDWTNSYSNLREHIKNIYNLSTDDFELHSVDEEDDLIKIKSDSELKTAYEFSDAIMKICLVEKSDILEDTDEDSDDVDEEKETKILPDVPKHLQLHSGIICDCCSNNIYGIRFVSKNIEDYDLCEDCFIKNSHKHIDFVPKSTSNSYLICYECFAELKTNINVCNYCTDTIIPQQNENLKNFRAKISTLTICDSCKFKNHEFHPIETKYVIHIYENNRRLADELKTKRNNYDQVKVHFDCGECCNCGRNGVVFRCTIESRDDMFLCDTCFEKGAYFYFLTFDWLSKEEADFLRLKSSQLQLKELELSQVNEQEEEKEIEVKEEICASTLQKVNVVYNTYEVQNANSDNSYGDLNDAIANSQNYETKKKKKKFSFSKFADGVANIFKATLVVADAINTISDSIESKRVENDYEGEYEED